MKILSVTVPCYNSQEYMSKAIDSLLVGGDRVEIIIINDGSKDNTGAIADKYAEKYPDVVKVVHQENGGHGEGINQGLKHSTGKYFYVLDSDDWLEKDAFIKVLDKLEELENVGGIDLMVANYIYAHAIKRKRQVIKYKGTLPQNKIFGWEDTKKFKVWQCLTIHTCIFRRQLMLDSKVELPKHTFYEDNLMVYIPLRHAQKLYYMDVDLYSYYIGRPDQSVQEEVVKRRCLQQKYCSQRLATTYNLTEISKTEPKLARYLKHESELLLTIATVVMRLNKTDAMEKENDAMWQAVIDFDPVMGKKMKNHSICWWVTRPGKFGRWLAITAYRISQMFVHLN
ncbi:MAG: glycosyltransferase family 2 protein [Clostridia bacterium]|nr:glycosyltransferase family 2 protein [Clostridia bacterium]